MKYPKKLLLLLLAAFCAFAAVQAGTVLTYADTSFTVGDFRYTLTSSTTVTVSKYLGSSTDVTLPESVNGRLVTGIYKNCFKDSDVVSVTIPRDYTSIGAFAFQDCASLETVRLPSSLKSIGVMAFDGCSALKNIDFETPQNLSEISFAAFSGCTSLESVSLPENVSLGDNAFSGCSSLSEVRLPASLTVVPEYAFYGCGFTSLDLPEGITKIKEGAFASNASLESLRLPYSLTVIGSGCFKDDPLLTEVFVSDKVTSIDTTSFSPMADSGTLTVTCYKDSCTAELYEMYGVRGLKVIDKILGDVNLDGVLDVTDATAIQKHLAELERFTATQLAVADANGDGEVDISDATAVQYRVAGIEI